MICESNYHSWPSMQFQFIIVHHPFPPSSLTNIKDHTKQNQTSSILSDLDFTSWIRWAPPSVPYSASARSLSHPRHATRPTPQLGWFRCFWGGHNEQSMIAYGYGSKMIKMDPKWCKASKCCGPKQLVELLSQNHLFGPILINIGHDNCNSRPSSWRQITAYTFSRPEGVHKKLGYTGLMGGQ